MDERENNILEDGEVIPVKVRETIRGAMAQATEDRQEFQRLAAEVKESANQAHSDEAAKFGQAKPKFTIPPQYRRAPRPNPDNVSEEERYLAAIAHGSALLTIAIAIMTGGVGALLTVFIPLGIYFAYRARSEYVAHHAMQAFGAQIVGVIGFGVLLVALVTAWVILLGIFALLSVILIGIPFLIMTAIVGLLVIAASFIIPLALIVYSMIATIEGLNGHYYSYPWIGDWVDDQIYGRTSNQLIG